MRLACLALLAFAPLAGAAPELDYDAALAQARLDEESLTAEQTQALVAAQGKVGGKALAECSVASGGVLAEQSPFTVVFELDAGGKIVRTWREGDSSIAQCFERSMQAQTLVAPPRVPFLTFFAMRWDD